MAASTQRLASRDAGQAQRGVARVDENACTLCGACEAACPVEAITLGEFAAQVDRDKCTGCAVCVDICPSEGITLT